MTPNSDKLSAMDEEALDHLEISDGPPIDFEFRQLSFVSDAAEIEPALVFEQETDSDWLSSDDPERVVSEDDFYADVVDCPPVDVRSRWYFHRNWAARRAQVWSSIKSVLGAPGRGARRTGRSVHRAIQQFGSDLGQGVFYLVQIPGRFGRWAMAVPSRLQVWVASLPWAYWMSVRVGFLWGALAGFGVAGSTLWALTAISYIPNHPMVEPVLTTPIALPSMRVGIPSELAWFFIQYPYLSENTQIRPKNHHTIVISDVPRKKDYVVTLGQKFRRVEIYNADSKDPMVQIFTPGLKKTVWFRNGLVVGQTSANDGNLWMWNTPLWNSLHLKIYGLADLWLDSPYKRYSCAGFVHKFLQDAGVNVPILDAWDIAKQPWKRITPDELEPGDIITIRALTASHRRFWHHSVTHVAVYIGYGKIIHAATSANATRSWVHIADLSEFDGRIDKILRPPELL